MPSDSKREWVDSTLDPVLKRFGERQDSFETGSGIVEDVLYTPEDREGSDYDRSLGYPGEYPYTRGRAADDVSWQTVDDAAVRGPGIAGGV